MIKKITIYTGCAVLGFAVCYLLFGRQNNQTPTTQNQTNSIDSQQWTCSMHPQIQEIELGTCALCGMELVVSTSNNIDDELSNNQFKMSKKALALANIETSLVGYSDDHETVVELSGIITTNKKTDAIQTTVFDGRIEKLNVNYVGAKIKKGQKIGRVYSPNLYAGQTKLLSSISYRNSHPELFNENRNTYGLWKITDEQIENIITSETPMMNFPIYADVSGTVTEVITAEGDFCKEGEPLLKISNLNTLWAIFDVYDHQLQSLKVGQSVVLTPNGFSEGSITGTINFIEPLLDSNKRTSTVRIVLNNKNGQLKPGMLIEANVKLQLTDEILTVPKTAVLWTGKRSVVYLKPYNDKPYFEMIEVTLGQSLEENYEILNGLNIGDEIVTEGTFTIDAVAQLEGKKSMMNTIMNTEQVYTSPLSSKDLNTPPTVIDIKTKSDMSYIIEDYIHLKNALVQSNVSLTVRHGKKLLNHLQKINTEDLSNKQKNTLSSISKITNTITTINDLEKQRASFKLLSSAFVDLVSTSKTMDQSIYIQFCPMADQNKGANWLSFEKEIRNPYFGDSMLKCGRITKEIK